MKLNIRPPREEEWRSCRMLLPETFGDAPARTYLLGLQDQAPHIVGAASFRRSEQALTHLRLHVIAPFRRRGIASRLIEQIASSGVHSMTGTAELSKEPAAQAFCESNHFVRLDVLNTVEADIAEMREFMRRLRARMVPASARVVPLRDAPLDQVSQLHAMHVAQEGELNQWRGLVAATPGMEICPVVMIGERVVGMLLGHVEGSMAVVRSRVVASGHHGTWVNAMLLAEALDIGWAAGARRARFSYTSSNHDTRKLALRLRAETTGCLAQFQRRTG